MPAVFFLREGELVEMVERPYASESVLQEHLAAHPELLSAEAPEDERRRWLLVKREMGVADAEDSPDRWSLDHLFVDQDAVPTFVEVKRRADTRVRRQVVGQMLDYAANASSYWDAGTLRASFESRFSDPDSAADELAAFTEGEMDADDFWEAVAGNLKDRRLRLVFVADRIPRELRSIVEFLNEQLQLTEVIAVEVTQYADPDGNRVNIVPRIIGETEMARRVKRGGGAGGTRRARLSEEEFYAQMRAVYAPELAERVLALYEHAKARGSRVRLGKAETNVWMGLHEDPDRANPVALTFWHDGKAVGVNLAYLRGRRSEEEMERLVELLRRLPATSQALDRAVARDYRSAGAFETKLVLATDDDLDAFKAVLDEAIVRATPERPAVAGEL
jgi:hypothetical protein